MRIGFIGLGTMGAPMARNLVEAGHDVIVHNRTREREVALAEAGADRAATPSAAAAGADCVITIVSDTPDVEAVLFAGDGVAATAGPGSVVIDMSTISPEATRDFAGRLGARGVGLLDAPVSGGSEGAVNGTLSIMLGGAAEDLAKVRPVLEVLGTTITHVGPVGAGQATKAVNQVVCGGMFLAVAEGLTLAMKSGLDTDQVLAAIGGGVCRSWVLENRARNMLDDDYPLGFRLALHLKDLRIALAAAADAGVDLPLARMVEQIEESMVADHADEDMSAIARDVRRRAGLG